MKGHLIPEDERALEDIVEALREQLSCLAPGQWFEARIGREQDGRISPRSVAIKPPHVYPVRAR